MDALRSILHISDVHFGPAHLRDRADGVLALIAQREPDYVVLSGDLTQRAKRGQFRQARRFVDQIEPPTLVVPGNHDVPLYRFWERLLAPLGTYRKHFSPELEPWFEDEQVALLGINTAFNFTLTGGRILRSQLQRAVDCFVHANASLFKIAVLHHHLVPPPNSRAPRVLLGASRALHELSEAGVDLVLAGHLHRSFLALAESQSDGGRSMTILHAGTTTSSRGRDEERGENTCNWIEVGRTETVITSLRWDRGSVGGGGFVETRHHRSLRRSIVEGGQPPADGKASP